MLTCALLGVAASPAPPAHDKKIPAARWDEQTPGCTFSQGPDGKLRYGMSLPDVAVVVAVDAQELEKVHRRHEPFFAVLLEVRNRGGQVLEVKPDKIKLPERPKADDYERPSRELYKYVPDHVAGVE